jgi:lipoprotein-anchoring transpeptidase ErfK/SrfK
VILSVVIWTNDYTLYVNRYNSSERTLFLTLRSNFLAGESAPEINIFDGVHRRNIKTNRLSLSTYEIVLEIRNFVGKNISIYVSSKDINGINKVGIFENFINVQNFNPVVDVSIVTAKTENGNEIFIDYKSNVQLDFFQVKTQNNKFFNPEQFKKYLYELEEGVHKFYFGFKNIYNTTFEIEKNILKIKDVVITENVISPINTQNLNGFHIVRAGESIYNIAKQYNVSPGDIVSINNIKDPSRIFVGQVLYIGNINYAQSPIHIEINLSENRLDLFYSGEILKSYIVAVGRSDATPPGYYKIYYKEKDPALYWKGEYIAPGSIINGVGTRWLQLSNPQYGIHGTTKPWEIGKRISHGCIRMFNFDVEELDFIASLGTEVYVY